jgi:catechol 2,3-dioxygenase-like lactoylglutathione lyase family enzyme
MKNIIEKMLHSYEKGGISRRDFVLSLAAITTAPIAMSQTKQSAFHGKTLNHITLFVKDVAKSKDFYKKLLSLQVRRETKDLCEFNLGESILGIYNAEDGPSGNDHFCIGIESFNADTVLEQLKKEFPSASPTMEEGKQIYLRDPDNIRFQLSATEYKR